MEWKGQEHEVDEVVDGDDVIGILLYRVVVLMFVVSTLSAIEFPFIPTSRSWFLLGQVLCI